VLSQTPDWRSIAKASGLRLSGKELDAAAAALDSLDAVFRPLVQDLTPELDPATGVRPEADPE
jgi:hypothetical protein